MELVQGCDMEQSLEQNITGVLNNIREIAGKVRASAHLILAHLMTHPHMPCINLLGNGRVNAVKQCDTATVVCSGKCVHGRPLHVAFDGCDG